MCVCVCVCQRTGFACTHLSTCFNYLFWLNGVSVFILDVRFFFLYVRCLNGCCLYLPLFMERVRLPLRFCCYWNQTKMIWYCSLSWRDIAHFLCVYIFCAAIFLFASWTLKKKHHIRSTWNHLLRQMLVSFCGQINNHR